MNFPAQVEDDVVLELARLDVRASELVLSFRVTNNGSVAAYLLNALFHRRGAAGWEVDRNLVYASVDEGSILQLKKQLVEVPEDIDVEYPEVPFATPLAPGAVFEETVVIPLPVEPADPYRPQPRTDPYDATGVSFTLGYVLEDEPLRTSAPSASGAEGLVRLDYTEVRMRQRLKIAGPIETLVPTVARAVVS